MIEITKSYKVGDKFFATVEEAQAEELSYIIADAPEMESGDAAANHWAKTIVNNKEAILNILTTGPRSHPRGRKANGATRKPCQNATAATAQPKTT